MFDLKQDKRLLCEIFIDRFYGTSFCNIIVTIVLQLKENTSACAETKTAGEHDLF